MKPARTYRDYLADILDAISKARQFVEGMSFEEFSSDEKTAFAVVRALEIIGEAAKKIPPTSGLASHKSRGVRLEGCAIS